MKGLSMTVNSEATAILQRKATVDKDHHTLLVKVPLDQWADVKRKHGRMIEKIASNVTITSLVLEALRQLEV
jgi:hypothetical protein